MNSVIILAGGKGERFNTNIPKQFFNLKRNKSILSISVNQFLNNKFIDEIIIVVPYDWVEKIKKQFISCKIIAGGKTRSQSSLKGLKKCSKKCQHVLIHDAARPLISQDIINECIAKLSTCDAVIPILDINDSLILKENNRFNYLDRKSIKLIQTPQGFRYNKIISVYENQTNETDDLSVLIKNTDAQLETVFIEGSKINFKITTEDDIKIAKKLVDEY